MQDELHRQWDGTGTFYFTSGATQRQISEWLEKWMPAYRNIVEVDQSKYDRHHSRASEELVLRVFNAYGMPDLARRVYRRLESSLKGRTPSGIKFTRQDAMMCTGVPHTCLGNSILNGLMTAWCLHKQGIGLDDFREMLMGDDSLILTSRPLDAARFSADFERLGFKIKLHLRKHITEATFCSNWFAPTKCGRYAPSPLLKTAYRIPWTVSQISTRHWAQYSHAVASSLQTATGTPILRELVRAMDKASQCGLSGKALRQFNKDFSPQWHYYKVDGAFEYDEQALQSALAWHYQIPVSTVSDAVSFLKTIPSERGIAESFSLRRIAQAVIEADLS